MTLPSDHVTVSEIFRTFTMRTYVTVGLFTYAVYPVHGGDGPAYHEYGHVVWARCQAALVVPLAAADTANHGAVPHPRPAAVAVHTLPNIYHQQWAK
jgi:hypothetical protein